MSYVGAIPVYRQSLMDSTGLVCNSKPLYCGDRILEIIDDNTGAILDTQDPEAILQYDPDYVARTEL